MAEPSAVNHIHPDQTSNAITMERPQTPKPKGARRLLLGLRSLSSTSPVARIRSSSSLYRGNGRASKSCVSLSAVSPTSYSPNHGSSSASRDYLSGFSTAPASAAGTPGIDTPFYDQNATSRLRPTLSPAPHTTLKTSEITIAGDYFSLPIHTKTARRRPSVDLWNDLPYELRMHILGFLTPKELVKASAVSKSFSAQCFDGALWFDLDTQSFYRDIPAEGLVNIVKRAGPFLRDLNLRNCVQLWGRWLSSGLVDACCNLEDLSLRDCQIDQQSMHVLLASNTRLRHINLSNLAVVTHTTMKTIADHCPQLESINVDWCINVDTSGLGLIINACKELKEIRAGETGQFGQGWDTTDILDLIFERNTLEYLLIPGCASLQDASLATLFEGTNTEIDYLTGRRIAPPRKLKHINFARCRNISDSGIQAMIGNVPELEGLQLSNCEEVTDDSLVPLLSTTPFLSHLDIDELDRLSNSTLQELARSPCKDNLQNLCISYCEHLGDAGMIPILRNCPNLRNLDLDNTRVSDLTLAEAAAQIRRRGMEPPPLLRSVTWDGTSVSASFSKQGGVAIREAGGRSRQGSGSNGRTTRPKIGLSMTVFDCPNITWQGIREVLSQNAQVRGWRPSIAAAPRSSIPSLSAPMEQVPDQDDLDEQDITHSDEAQSSIPFPSLPGTSSAVSIAPTQIIALKVFYGYQQTVQEHTRRVLRGDHAAATRLERKWAEYMMASEEAGAAMGVGTGGGVGHVNAHLGALGLAGNRRRRRRVREAQMMHADEAQAGVGQAAEGANIGRRRRARTAGGCAMM